MASTNQSKLKGVVLDLRFADGTDYKSAAAVADLFLDSEQPLISWGNETTRSTHKTDAISIPVAVLVNSQTSGAAEALAAVLRETSVGLLLGSPTAGQASVFKEFPLSNGSQLKIATEQVKIAGDKPVAQSLTPDITVTTPAQDEKAYMLDAYKVLHQPIARDTGDTNQADATATNHVRRRFNEAELVRQQREGPDAPEDSASHPRKDEPVRPTVSDPALARALDLLKALSVVPVSRKS